MFIIDLHAKEKLTPQPSLTDASFLLLHLYAPILKAKHLIPVGRGKGKTYPRYLVFVAWSELRRRCPIPQKIHYVDIILVVGQRIQELKQ